MKTVVLSFTYLVDTNNTEMATKIAMVRFKKELQHIMPGTTMKPSKITVEKLFFERNERISVYSVGK